MKKIISLIVLLLLLASFVEAQTTAGYWSTATKGQSDKFNQNGYEYGYTATTTPADTAYYVVSRNIGLKSATGDVRNGFMGSKILVGIAIDTAFADVAATVTLEISGDGTNYYALATLDSDCTPNVTGVQWYLADFSSTYAPYARIKFNASGLVVCPTGTTGYVHFVYAIPL